MAKLINIGFGNVVNSQKIVAVVNPDAAPVKRMVQSVKGTILLWMPPRAERQNL